MIARIPVLHKYAVSYGGEKLKLLDIWRAVSVVTLLSASIEVETLASTDRSSKRWNNETFGRQVNVH